MALQKCNVNFSARILGWIFDVNFWRWISWGWIFEGALFIGKHRTKKFDPRIRPQNSGLKNSHPRIRPQIRVHEVQNPLCGNLPLTFLSLQSQVARNFCDSPFWGSTSRTALRGGSKYSCQCQRLPVSFKSGFKRGKKRRKRFRLSNKAQANLSSKKFKGPKKNRGNRTENLWEGSLPQRPSQRQDFPLTSSSPVAPIHLPLKLSPIVLITVCSNSNLYRNWFFENKYLHVYLSICYDLKFFRPF